MPSDPATTSVTITDSLELGAITDAVHDRWVDLDDLTYDETSRVLTLPFGLRAPRKQRSPGQPLVIVEAHLRIANVSSYRIEDQAHINIYDFNELSYDDVAGAIVITSSFPVTITASVTDVSVTIQQVS